jgi:hypothetical protein
VNRRIPWWAVGVTLLVIVTAFFATNPIRDAATLQPVGEAGLELSAGYLAIEPISSVLDTLTLLTVWQHVALLLWAIALYAGIRVWFARRGGRTSPRRELAGAGIFLAVILATYAAAAVAPRPMARLALNDGAVLAVDFHAHTQHSHDGRPGWTASDVRRWHRASGFDAVYITDHRTVAGAEEGIAENPPVAGEGTMVLQGLEAGMRGEHVNILGAGRRYLGLTGADLRDVDEGSLTLASMLPGNEPVVVETIPGVLTRVPELAAGGRTTPGIRAIELVDGSPRGLSQGRADRARVVALADSFDLALVAGSDNHGWGRTAPGWTLLRVGGWRGMGTDSLGRAIEFALREARRGATRVVERNVAGGSHPIALLVAAPLVTWRMFTMLSPDERVIWLFWTWGVVLVLRGVHAYRVRPAAAT